MENKVKVSFSIPKYKDGYRTITSEKVDSTEFRNELVSKLKQAGINDFHFEPQNLLVELSIAEGEKLVVNCARGLDMVALRIFMCLVVKYDSVLGMNYYIYEWNNIMASLSVYPDKQ